MPGAASGKRFLLALAAGAIVLPGVSAAQGVHSDDASELLRLEQRWIEAIQKRDLTFLDNLIDENFVDTAPDGHLRNKHDLLTSPTAQNVELEKLKDLQVRMHGDVGVVTGVNVITGKSESYVATVHFTDVFQKIDGKWKAIAAQENVSVAQP